MARVLVNTVSLSDGALTRERNLLQALANINDHHSYHILWTPETRAAVGALPANFSTETVEKPAGRSHRIIWENTQLLSHVRRVQPDVLYFPLHITNLFDMCPKVAAVRNAAPFFPSVYAKASPQERLRLRLLRQATRRTVSQAESVVFMSRSTKERVAEWIPAAEKKGVVIQHGIPEGFQSPTPETSVLEQYGLPERYLFSVSNIVRYKNIRELVIGYARARKQADLPPLYLAGRTYDSQYEHEIRETIHDYGLSDQVVLMGYVDHDDLPSLYAGCDGFVFSSTCENAPVTLIEALACETAIATSNRASMPEICRDAALYFDPEDTRQIADTLVELCTDPDERKRLRTAAGDRATDFTWEQAAQKTSILFNNLG